MSLKNIGKMKLCFAMAVILPVAVVAAESGSAPPLVIEKGVKDVRTPEFSEYQYGMTMDISKVISMKYFPPRPKFCGAIPAIMTYLDSKGEKHALRYLYPETSGCTN